MMSVPGPSPGLREWFARYRRMNSDFVVGDDDDDVEEGEPAEKHTDPDSVLNEADAHRTEQPWLKESEELLKTWRAEAVASSSKHLSMARWCRSRHIGMSIAGMLIPGIMTPVSVLTRSIPNLSYVEMVAFAATGVLNSVSSVMDYGARSERHYSYSGRYGDLVTDIDQELTKPRRFRQPVDTFTLHTKMVYDTLNLTAPDA